MAAPERSVYVRLDGLGHGGASVSDRELRAQLYAQATHTSTFSYACTDFE